MENQTKNIQNTKKERDFREYFNGKPVNQIAEKDIMQWLKDRVQDMQIRKQQV